MPALSGAVVIADDGRTADGVADKNCRKDKAHIHNDLLYQVAAVLLLPLLLGLDGIWLAIVAAEVLALVITVYFLVKTHPERFYHGFVLGMIVNLSDRYQVTSNRESGYGRYDVMIEPFDKNEKAFITIFLTSAFPVCISELTSSLELVFAQ